MSDLWNVISSYNAGESAFEKGNYIEAARQFRSCYLYYEYGELPQYYEEVDKKGCDSINRYKEILNKYLTEEEVIQIKAENNKMSYKSGDIDINMDNFEATCCAWANKNNIR